jgi:hypothetical protein
MQAMKPKTAPEASRHRQIFRHHAAAAVIMAIQPSTGLVLEI